MASTEIVKTKSEENLIPFRKGHDARRGRSKGRPTPLSNPDFVDLFARAVSEGLTIKELADLFDIGERT